MPGKSSIELGADCRFELPIETATPVVTVVAVGPGQRLRRFLLDRASEDRMAAVQLDAFEAHRRWKR